jgi:glycerol-3-phosphate dehydrogenase
LSGTQNYYDQAAIIAKGHRYFIITPWRECSLVGTYEVPFNGDPDNLQVTEEDIYDFLRHINEAFPAAELRRQDVYFAYVGLLPDSGTSTNVQSMKHFKILDHEQDIGKRGLISVVGVKFTTARDVAENTVDLVVHKLGRQVAACQTGSTPVHGGLIFDVNKTAEEAERSCPYGLSVGSLRHLVQTYGSQYRDIIAYCRNDERLAEPLAPGVSVIKAEVIHGIRSELAQTLSDIIFRRTELGTSGYPGDLCLDNCARIFATELQWTGSRIEREKEAVRSEYRRVSCLPQTTPVSCTS